MVAVTIFTSYAQSPVAMLTADATVQWENLQYDFGTIPQRTPQSTEFTFTNHSSVPVVITEAVGSCGCTVASYTEGAVAPGEQGVVRVTYNAAQLGAFAKTVSVTLNTEKSPRLLRIQGTVVK